MKITIKTTIVACIVASIAFVSCSKDDAKSTTNTPTTIDVPKVNKVILMDITGTWCPPCGSYGIPGFNQSIKLGGAAMIPMSVHSGDELSCTPGNTLMAYTPFSSNSVPRIATGNGLLFPAGVYSDTNATAAAIVRAVTDSAAAHEVVVGAVISNKTVDNTTLSFDVNTKFFTDVKAGDYYLGVYVVEDGIIAAQKKADGSTTAKQVHNHVLRSAVTATFGDSWATGAIAANTTKSKNFKVTILPAWKGQNLHVEAVIWSKVGTKYYFVNGNTTYAE